MRASLCVLISSWLLTASIVHGATVPTTINFQGVLRDKTGKPITSPVAGTPVVLSLYTAPAGGAAVWSETQSAHAVNGLFSVSLGSVTTFASTGLTFDKPYWVGLTVGIDPVMTPRLPLQSVPYALNAWNIGGNSDTNPATYFLGTTDDKPLVLKANTRRVAQYQDALSPSGFRSVNVLAGSEVNVIGAGAVGSTIAGGGRLNNDATRSINDMQGSFSVIGGGAGNFADASSWMVIGGGRGNITQGLFSTVGGGDGNSSQADSSTVAGGRQNFAGGTDATVAGGNTNQATGPAAFIGGGTFNQAAGTDAAVAGGEGHNAYGSHAFIGGGTQNRAADLGAVAGGQDNQAAGLRSFVGSGLSNTATTGYDIVIGGGNTNSATGSSSAILGGSSNIASATYGSVGGGSFNEAGAESAAEGGGRGNNVFGAYSFAGGGDNNDISHSYAAIAGGKHNYVDADGGFIGSGENNYVGGLYGIVPGGIGSWAYGQAFAAGYHARALHTGSFVWSDYSVAQDFVSQGDNQFCIRAAGGVLLETGQNAYIFTGAANAELNRYLVLLNSPGRVTASGLKAGGILCADDFAYSNPGKSNMVVKGTLAVGYADPAPYTFAVNGNIFALNGYASSDARYKRNVHTLNDALSAVTSLRGVSFEWDREAWKDENFPAGQQIGFIAQEVEKVLPEIVSTDGKGFKAVSYQSLVPVLVEAVKDQQKRIEAKDGQVAALRDSVATLERQNDALEQRLQRLEQALRGAPGRSGR